MLLYIYYIFIIKTAKLYLSINIETPLLVLVKNGIN